MIEEGANLVIKEVAELIKYDGEPIPENAVERIIIEDGKIISVEKLEGGL